MEPSITVLPRTNQTFCFYCEVPLITPEILAKHIYHKHRDTHAYETLITILNKNGNLLNG